MSARQGSPDAGANSPMKSANSAPYSDSSGERAGCACMKARAMPVKNSSPTKEQTTGNCALSASIRAAATLLR
jgi:hypothetical protein